MSTTIKPTVGRVVLIFFADNALVSGYVLPASDEPVPGLIARVHSDTCINVAAFDANGDSLPMTSVRLLQEGDERPTSGIWAEWMPYQIGQAKKAEDREHDAKQMAVAADRASDDRRMRAGALDMALRTPGLANHQQVLKAAEAYQAHIEGEKTAPAPLPDTLVAGQRTMIDEIARVCHEVNRAYCQAMGDDSQPAWEDAPAWQRESARMGVDLHLMGDFGPEASHISWMKQKLADGWTYGPVKDPELKQHPCLVPFDQLPREQQAKDYLFRGVVHALRP